MKLLKANEVADMLGVTVGTIKTWAKNKSLIGIRMGASGRWCFELSEVEAYVQRQKESSYNTIEPVIKEIIPFAPTIQEIDNQIIDIQSIPIVEPVPQKVATEPTEPIELMMELHSKGMTNQKISDHLNSLGLVTNRGKQWNNDSVFRRVKRCKDNNSLK